MMLDFIKNIPQDLHPILIHFPIAFLGFSFVLSFLSMRVSRWNEASWLLLWVGGLSCIPASVSGVISHFPYEETELHEVIGTHQNFGILGTLFVFVLVGIRYWTGAETGILVCGNPIWFRLGQDSSGSCCWVEPEGN